MQSSTKIASQSKKKRVNLWYAEVAPLTALPITGKQLFTYASEVEIFPGALVSVPLMTRTINGVVFAVRIMDDTSRKALPFRVKKINAVIQEGFLTPEQLQLALFISKEYLAPLGRCLVHFAPHITKQSSLVATTVPMVIPSSRPIRITKEQSQAVKALVEETSKPVYLFGPASSGKTEVYIRALKKSLKKNEQGLVLVPEIALIPQEEARYGEAFGRDHIAVLHGQLAPGAFYALWGKIARGEVRIIIGTRQVLFAPFQKLRLIIVDEEQDNAYKQWDMAPRYDGRKVAETLASLHSATLVFGSATPSIERFHKAILGEYRLVRLSSLAIQPRLCVETINMRFEKKRKYPPAVSDTLLTAIKTTLEKKQQILLFVNRQGTGYFSLCMKCKTILRCPSCERALAYDMQSGKYRCSSCVYRTSVFPACSQCGGMHFSSIGIGTQKVEREIRKHFPAASLDRLDGQSARKNKDARATTFHNFASGKTDILIGTQMTTKGWDLPNVTLIGMIDADSLFSFPDFSTDENAFQHIVQASGRVARIGSVDDGLSLIQTYYPENPTLLKACMRSYEDFYQETIEQRGMMDYPPFARVARIIVEATSEKTVENKARRLIDKLTIVAESYKDIRVSEIQKSTLGKVRGHYRRHIILRCRGSLFPEPLITVLQSIAKECIVDIDPMSIV